MGRTKLHDVQDELKRTKAELQALQRQKNACRTAFSQTLPLGDHITVLSVGMDFESIYLHTGLIPSHTKLWIASHGLVNNLVYPLIEQSADMLRRYRLFLYTGKIVSKDEDSESPHEGDSEWHQLILMHNFANEIRDEKFANTVINAIVEKVQEEDSYPTEFAHDVWEATKYGDPLRKLYLDLHVWLGQGEGIQSPYDDRNGPAEFLRHVRLGLAVAGEKVYDAGVQPPWETSLCLKYHKHEVTAICGTEQAEIIDLTED